MDDAHVASILELLAPPKGFQPWHGGPTLMGCLRGVDAQQAAWKPAPDRHSIWELALHIAYWKYAVRRHLNPSVENGFARSPANWAKIMDTSDQQWKMDKQLIRLEHELLVDEIKAFPPKRLDERSTGKKKWTYRQLLQGIAAHDIYHIGQIQLMKRLYKSMNVK